jgi:GH15 family glucan-1,4-alpha-glucosidase
MATPQKVSLKVRQKGNPNEEAATAARTSDYLPIENHGIIGNLRTAALVGTDGSIDWFCVPNFDSPSVFASLLDHARGGYFRIQPAALGFISKQHYWPSTNVLVTHFRSSDGSVEITDFMPMGDSKRREAGELVRRVEAVRGVVELRLECRPAFNYARDSHQVELDSAGAIFRSSSLGLALSSSVPLRLDENGVEARFTLKEGETAAFLLQISGARDKPLRPFAPGESDALWEQTVDYWLNWIAKCNYTGRWREMVYRSALTLELLVYEPTGAVIAAPTASLPERIGGGRNWDYRCSWIRDSAFTVYSLLRVGLTDEAHRFAIWIQSLCSQAAQSKGGLQTVYGIDGRESLKEETLGHLEGYRGSRPVRIGNAAYHQLQMDIYGELMDAVYLYNKYGNPISSTLWSDLRRLADWVCDNWQKRDNGIWEVRSGPQHFVYSKVMCWVAVDRALRLAIKRSLPADLHRWATTRDRIYEQVLRKGWNSQRQAFVQRYGGTTLDASCLKMPLVFFMSPTDPKMTQTLDAICRPVSQGGLLSDGSVYRYDTGETDDGVDGREGTFNICGFWLVEALTRAGRTDPARLRQALLLFEKMLRQANHLGLYSEEAGPCGEAWGNFPQAFTHLSLISAAVNLDQALGDQSK